jgi:hypothetical protein
MTTGVPLVSDVHSAGEHTVERGVSVKEALSP